MATIVNEPQATVNAGGLANSIFGPFQWLMQHAIGILIVMVLAIAIGVIIYLYIENQERKREQEDMLYKEYKDTIRACRTNQDPKMYTRHYSKWNLLFLGLPLFHYRKGRKVFDRRQEFVGYYDGMMTDYLGNTNFLLWKTKIFFFFKDHFMLRCPTTEYQLREIEINKDEKNPSKKKEFEYQVKKVQLPDGLIIQELDKTHQISMINMQKKGYYYYPVYQDKSLAVLNLTESINAMDKINHSDNLLNAVIRESGKAVIGMAKVNTQLVYEQRQPEKVKEVEKDDKR